jgi:hypothetical protein
MIILYYEQKLINNILIYIKSNYMAIQAKCIFIVPNSDKIYFHCKLKVIKISNKALVSNFAVSMLSRLCHYINGD